ncbi:MOSC domain-containing protein, partial [Campylobacter jejuni]|nr:MOSC domain-containing protein [Campylobacter jejuni]
MKIQSLQIGKIKNYKNFQNVFIKDTYLEETQI